MSTPPATPPTPASTSTPTATTRSARSPRSAKATILPSSIDDVFDRPGSIRALAVLRIVLGPVVVIHFAPHLAMTAAGEDFTDHFYAPWFSFLPEPPGAVHAPLVWIGAAAAVAMMVGWRTRATATMTAVCVTGTMFLSQTYFRHNRAFLVFLVWAVALGASGQVLSLDARRRARRAGTPPPADDRATLWPLWTIRYLAASVYLASGFSKLIDPDWVGGLVLWDRAVRYQHLVSQRVPGPLGDLVVDVVTTRWVHAITSPIAVAMELFIGIGLWFHRTRIPAILVAVFFHLSIELAASVEVFSIAAIAALAIWITPRTRDRIVTGEIPAWVAPLDWFARFDRHPGPGTLRVVDRDGRAHTGAAARWFLATRLPLLFFVAAPVSVLRRRRDRPHPDAHTPPRDRDANIVGS